MDQAAKEEEVTFHSQVVRKGKKAITQWEKELKDK
jgi:acyl-coenzyme A thioesterase PaaI-like protein